MNIVIYEDDRDPFSDFIENIILAHGQIVLKTNSINEIKNHLIMSDLIEIYLLEIWVNGRMDGLEVFNLIKDSKNSLCIFISDHLSYILDNPLVKVNIFSFIKRNQLRLEEELDKTLELARQKIENENLLIMESKFNQISISIAGIYYIESSDHKIIIYHEDGLFTVRIQLHAVLKQLPPYFVLCHRSYIVNRLKIERYDTKSKLIILKDGFHCPYVKGRMIWLF